MNALSWIPAAFAALALLAYGGLPILIKVSLKQSHRSRVLRLEGDELEEPALRAFVADSSLAFAALGFRCVALVELFSPGQRGPRGALFRSEDGDELALALVAPEPNDSERLNMQRYSFFTPIVDGLPIETLVVREAPRRCFPRTAWEDDMLEHSMFPFLGELDPAEVLPVHRDLVQAKLGDREIAQLEAGSELRFFEWYAQAQEGEVRAAHYFTGPDEESMLSPTWFGAYAMTWKQLWPVANILRFIDSRETKALMKKNLAAVGREAPGRWDRAAPGESESRLAPDHPLLSSSAKPGVEPGTELLVEREVAIRAHVAAHVGPVAEQVFADIVPGIVRVAVNFVPPTEERPYWYLFTTGMSARPMPSTEADARFAELAMALPADWKLEGEEASRPEHFWPLYWLRKLARLPHEMKVAVGPGVSIPNGHPAEPVSEGTEICCMLLAEPVLGGVDFPELILPDGALLRFLAVVPLLPSEMAAKLDLGPAEFMARFETAGITELVSPGRSPFL